jgi:hypothetical protein
MTDRDGALDRLVETVFRAHDPRARAIDHFAETVSAIFADAAERDGANQELHMRLMDVNTQARALRSRAEARYGPAAELFDRMQAHGSGLSARMWC